MSPFKDFPGDPWGNQLLEQDLEKLIGDLRRKLNSKDPPSGYLEEQLSGFGNTTQSVIVLEKNAVLTDQELEEAALSLFVYRGRIHLQTDVAHLHPDQGTNIFLLSGQQYEIQAVEPSGLVATFMWFG